MVRTPMEQETNETLMKECGTRVEFVGAYNSSIRALTSKEVFDSYFIYSRNRDKNVRARIACNPIDDEWKRRIRENFWGKETLEEALILHPVMDKRLWELKERLLDFAGEEVCLSGYEDDLENILNYGQFWVGSNAKMMRGAPSRCHDNSSRLWEQNREQSRICTGYALTEDGMWRQHSWVVWMKERSNQIIETTEKRILYFGFVMTNEQCEEFAYNNW